MQPEPPPALDELAALAAHRATPSVTLQLATSPLAVDIYPTRIEFRNLAAEVERQLDVHDTPSPVRKRMAAALAALNDDEEFWRSQDEGLVVLADDEQLRAFRLHETVTNSVAVGDRFDVGALLRDATAPDRAFLLELTEGTVRLLALTRDRPPIEEPIAVPDDVRLELTYADNTGDADKERAGGAVGQNPERRRYSSIIQDVVLTRIGPRAWPLVLAASIELEPAYREINRYPLLVQESLGINPSYQEPGDLADRAWKIIDAARSAELAGWRELFGTRHAHGLAVSGLQEVATAATAAAVEELIFDVDAVVPGSIDEFGVLHAGDFATPPVYNVVDEIVARVLSTDGRVRSVHADELVDESPVAAMLRFPVST